MGPLLFSMYTNPLSSIIQSHRGIKHHFYTDDTQLYITLSPSNFSQSMTALTDCLNDIQNFMAANKLKLNPDKTEFILIGSKYSRKQLHSLFPTDILGNKVARASNVKNLGVVFDPNLTLTDHISQVIKSTRIYIGFVISLTLTQQYSLQMLSSVAKLTTVIPSLPHSLFRSSSGCRVFKTPSVE